MVFFFSLITVLDTPWSINNPAQADSPPNRKVGTGSRRFSRNLDHGHPWCKECSAGFLFFLGEHWAIDHRHFQCWSLCKVCYAFPLPHGRRCRSECASSRCCLLLNGLFMLIHGAMTTRISRFGCRFRVPRLGGKVSFSLLWTGRLPLLTTTASIERQKEWCITCWNLKPRGGQVIRSGCLGDDSVQPVAGSALTGQSKFEDDGRFGTGPSRWVWTFSPRHQQKGRRNRC